MEVVMEHKRQWLQLHTITNGARLPTSSNIVLDNFEKWLQMLNTEPNLTSKKEELPLDTRRQKLGQSRLALTSYSNAVIEIHRDSVRKTGDSVICLRSAHEKLFIALRLCYTLNLEPSNTGRRLVQEIFHCNRNLHSIFSVLSFCHVTKGFPHCHIDCFTLFPGVTSESFGRLVLPALQYYFLCLIPRRYEQCLPQFRLHVHLNQPIDDSTSITPLMAATMMKDPKLVRLLLRFGANPLLKIGVTGTEDTPQSPIDYIICYLNGFCSLSKYSKFDGSIFQQALECFYCMTNSVTNIQIKKTCTQWNSNQHFEKRSPQKTFSIHPNLTQYIPEISSASSLQNLSKTSIRQHLIQHTGGVSWESIKRLPFPQILKGYLYCYQ